MQEKKFAEFIGIMLGDGCLSKNRIKISLNSKEDLEYLKYVKIMIRDLFDIDPIIKFRKNENTVDLFVFKRKIINLLLQQGLKLSPKWNNAEIPKKFTSHKISKYVLRGYFDTDGCLVTANNNNTLYPRLEIKICPSPMKNQFIKILKENKLKFGIYEIGKGKVRIQLNGREQLNKWITLIGFSNARHINKINRFSFPKHL